MGKQLDEQKRYAFKNIHYFIPIGKMFAITREQLVRETNLSDREVRQAITEARQDGYCILNNSNGSGYYFPTIEELSEAKKFIKQETSRIKNISKNLNCVKSWVADVERGVIL